MESKKGRGAIYIVWGNHSDAVLERSKKSLKLSHPELPIEVVRIDAKNNSITGLRSKSRMMSLSPFAETLFLDADTVVLSRLDFGFDKVARFGLACCISACPWARRYHKAIKGDVVEYNTGVVFFTEKAKPVFDAWERLAQTVDASMVHYVNGQLGEMKFNDQCSFAMAIEETGYLPFMLPINWNFHAPYIRDFFGPIRIWHGYADPPKVIYDQAAYYDKPGSVIQQHWTDDR